ncbi:PilZ domain-containing protein [Lentibacillus sp. Marseille-P4043]|uniref:PilZ domain-containing protein n=1 Tax=Lentibacillus sp. Marseille-P4043 TaxID=2040293 RepID=UPI000D0B41FC|nr:PilZ domain-containing protein [Lentibacillus sp. Marseille-P4043]
MRYKREEPFRYTFDEPISALFQIKEIDGHSVETSEGEAKIIDISPEGVKLNSELNLPDTIDKSIHLSISFALNGNPFDFIGIIVWKKKVGTATNYGIDFLTDDSAKQALVEQIKLYAKNQAK